MAKNNEKQTNQPNNKQTQAVSNSNGIKEMEGRQGQHFPFFFSAPEGNCNTHAQKEGGKGVIEWWVKW